MNLDPVVGLSQSLMVLCQSPDEVRQEVMSIVCALITKLVKLRYGIARERYNIYIYITEKLWALYDYVGSIRLPIISACKSAIVSPYTPAL